MNQILIGRGLRKASLKFTVPGCKCFHNKYLVKAESLKNVWKRKACEVVQVGCSLPSSRTYVQEPKYKRCPVFFYCSLSVLTWSRMHGWTVGTVPILDKLQITLILQLACELQSPVNRWSESHCLTGTGFVLNQKNCFCLHCWKFQ